MKQRVALHLLGLAAVLLWGAGNSRAGIQVEQVYWLGTGTLELCEKPDGAYLVESHAVAPGLNSGSWDRLPRGSASRWYVSAPTIRSQSGRLLAGDPEGRNPTVHLVGEKAANTRWVFEFVSTLQPQSWVTQTRERHKEGPSGFTFRVKMAEGPFQDWYLAAGEPPVQRGEGQDQAPALQPLKLVPDVEGATIFTYIKVNYRVEHK
jgi:hypothetical protein